MVGSSPKFSPALKHKRLDSAAPDSHKVQNPACDELAEVSNGKWHGLGLKYILKKSYLVSFLSLTFGPKWMT